MLLILLQLINITIWLQTPKYVFCGYSMQKTLPSDLYRYLPLRSFIFLKSDTFIPSSSWSGSARRHACLTVRSSCPCLPFPRRGPGCERRCAGSGTGAAISPSCLPACPVRGSPVLSGNRHHDALSAPWQSASYRRG